MNSDLKKRFRFIQEQKKKNLLREAQSVIENLPEESMSSGSGEGDKKNRWRKEVIWFLFAVAVSYGLSWLIHFYLMNLILEEEYVIERDWPKPPDETMIQVTVNQEFWRQFGILHLYAIVCLLGCYLTRATKWVLNRLLPDWLNPQPVSA